MISGDYVTLTVDGEPSERASMRAYVVRPSGAGPHPALILFQEALGVNAQLRGVAAWWAGEGYLVVAPEMFHRTHPGFEYDTLDMGVLMPLLKTLTPDGMIADARAAHAWLTAQPDVDATRIAALGFCMGGRATYLANATLPLAAAVSYYAGSLAPALLDRAPHLHAPHLFFWGGHDAGIPPEQHRAVIDALRAAGKRFVDVEFSEPGHAFFNEQTDRYDRDAAEQSWAMAAAFLRSTLRR